jgi:hypothetical protein
MKITICGSMTFVKEMLEAKAQLEAAGHEVKMPPTHVRNNQGQLQDVFEVKQWRDKVMHKEHWTHKTAAMRTHFAKVVWADAILVLNYTKNGVENYVGANSLLEMGLAFHLGLPIYLLHPAPKIAYYEEVVGMEPIVLDGDLLKIPAAVRQQAVAAQK